MVSRSGIDNNHFKETHTHNLKASQKCWGTKMRHHLHSQAPTKMPRDVAAETKGSSFLGLALSQRVERILK
jgi:hypothetical protein